MLRKYCAQVRRFCLIAILISIPAALCSYRSSASTTTGLIIKLTGDFVVADAVGNNHLTLVGGTKPVPGKIGTGLSFDGNGYAKRDSQIYSQSGGTISLWFMSRDTPVGPYGPYNFITGGYDGGEGRTPSFFLYQGDLFWELAEFGDLYFYEAPLTHVIQDRWYHVAMTYDSDFNITVYLNGALAIQRQSRNLVVSPEMFVIGAHCFPSTTPVQYFNGLVDEVKVYNRPLSAAEIQATYNGQDITAGLSSWFPGDLSAKDCLVAGTCTLQNGVTADSGVLNQAFKFAGINDQVTVPDSAALSAIDATMSIKAWIRTTDSNTAPRIAAKVSPDSSGGFDLHLASGKLQMSVSDAQSQVTATSVKAVNDGHWHYVAGVYDGNTLSLYIDGVQNSQTAGSITIRSNNGQPLTVGAWQGAFPYAGLIDELEIYNRALSAEEINDSYGPVSKWSADGNADDSISGNNFTLLGGATFDPAGKVGQAFSFDGVSGYGTTNFQTYSQSGGTVALWFLSKGQQADPPQVITGSPTFYLRNGGYLFWELGNVVNQPSLTDVVPNQWYHVAKTYDSDFYVKVYLNGALAAQGLSNKADFGPQAGIGALPNSHGASGFFNGLVDEMVIYNRPLVADEIRQMVPSIEISAGSDVTIPIGQTTLTFSEVTTAGTTTVTPIDPSTVGQVPGGFAVSDSIAYEIATTASFTGSVTLAFKVPGPISEEDFDSLAILHNVNGTLVDVTASTPARDFANLTIYATTTSFSPFYLARKGAHIKTLFDQTKAYKRGSTIPVKLQVLSAGDSNLSSSGTSLVTRDLKLVSGNTLSPVADSGDANPDYTFRYESTLGGAGGGYIFNLSTKGLASGQYVLSFYVGADRSFFYTVKFEVK